MHYGHLLRDQAWLAQAPVLLDASPAFDFATWRSGLDWLALAEKAAANPEPLQPRTRRLGFYFEQQLAWLLAQHPDVTDLVTNLQVVGQGVTLGEFDLIFRWRNQPVHLETAVKFYICTGEGQQMADFIGPNSRDRMDLKFERMQSHQLALSKTAAGAAALKARGFDKVEPQLLVLGYLFYPYGQPVPETFAPGINVAHSKGWWLRAENLSQLPQTPEVGYLALPRLRWLAPAVCDDQALVKLDELQVEEPVLLAQMRRDDKGWYEVSRGFVLPSGWTGELQPRRKNKRGA